MSAIPHKRGEWVEAEKYSLVLKNEKLVSQRDREPNGRQKTKNR